MAATKGIEFVLYRIYYADTLVYIGRTKQPLQDRIRGHLFKKPMHRELSIERISKIEYSTYQSAADMYLYEIYYINLYKPPLNRDDKAADILSVSLPEKEWKVFTTPLWEKWKQELAEKDRAEEETKANRRKAQEKDREMRKKRREGTITEDEYWQFWEEEKNLLCSQDNL